MCSGTVLHLHTHQVGMRTSRSACRSSVALLAVRLAWPVCHRPVKPVVIWIFLAVAIALVLQGILVCGRDGNTARAILDGGLLLSVALGSSISRSRIGTPVV